MDSRKLASAGQRAIRGLAMLGLLGLLLGCAPLKEGSQVSPGEVPRFEPAPCPVPAFRGVTCGYLVVPENRDDPNSGEPSSHAIRLAVAILPSRSEQPAPDPVVYLTGGPGASAIEPLKAWRKSRFLDTRDVILFEQRGTKYAQPALECPEVEEVLVENMALALSTEEEVAREVEAAAACRDRLLAEGVDLSAYHSAASAADLEDLRQALGYEQWNLYGVSYGTRLALTAMRDYPEGIRSAILNSPFPPVADTYVEMVPNAQQAFHALFADCEADPACRAAYPNLEQRFYHGLEQANAHPLSVAIHVPPGRVQLTAKDLIAGLFSSLRGPKTNALLPFVISQIYEENQDVLAPMVEDGLPSFSGASRGMLHSVECYEEAPFNAPAAIQAAAQVQPILLDYLPIHFNLAICDVWPSGQAGSIETEPVRSDIPTLLLTGEYDPYTPPSWGQRAAETLSHSYVYEFPGTGHGPMGASDCGRGIARAFLDDPLTEPDTSCLAELTDPEFITPDDLFLTPAVYRLNVDLFVAPNPLRLGLLALCLLACLAEVIPALSRWLRGRVEPERGLDRLARGWAVAVAGLNLAFFAGLVGVVLYVSSDNALVLAFGLPAGMGWLFWLPRVAALLTLGLPVLAVLVWLRGDWSQGRRARYTLFTLAALAFALLLLHWQMLA